jgi:hypothetical protein
MDLTIIHQDEHTTLQLEAAFITANAEFFEKMDKDMNNGWQMSREWVENPDITARCQIAASKLLVGLEQERDALVQLMAGYNLSKLPDTKTIYLDTDGEMQDTLFK